jgi:hypothetical protein
MLGVSHYITPIPHALSLIQQNAGYRGSRLLLHTRGETYVKGLSDESAIRRRMHGGHLHRGG